MKPARIEFEIGKTRWGQPLRLVLERGSDGVSSWTLYRDRANQLDDTDQVHGLTDEAILNMAEAIKSAKELSR